ncbi:PhzF family phenazine biosynthesis protein, partial [Chitinimonas sp.]|uniref:PhzF family phenazine biosynthesis protein n=1 Tax=Chitinimonas sp. TaxID=1934313 RepID=UPI0035B44722
RDPALLGRIQSNADLLARHAANPGGLTAYVFARTAQGFAVRFFWVQNGSLGEDPGTGSACANLGGWWRARHPGVALDARVEQGDFIGRPNRLSLTVSQDGAIRVGGQVVEIGRGSLDW